MAESTRNAIPPMIKSHINYIESWDLGNSWEGQGITEDVSGTEAERGSEFIVSLPEPQRENMFS